MSDYVLEILDGDQAGTVVELDSDRLSIGRRPGNDLVLTDEKCSGKHAEIVFEDGGAVLRDLGSTNGTLMDGGRIDEIALTAGDVFHVGRVRIRFRSASGAPAGAAAGESAMAAAGGGAEVEDVQMHRLDAAALKRGRGRGSMFGLVLGVLVLGAGGFWVWQTYLAGGEGGGAGGVAGGGGGGGGPSVPLEVPGNLLPAEAANLEGEEVVVGEDGEPPSQSGWVLETGIGGSSFQSAYGRGLAHTGEMAVEAIGLEAGTEGVAPFALARLAEPVRVSSDRPVRLAAHVRASGGARAAARLVFFSSADEDGESLRTGMPLAAGDDWEERVLEVEVPRGMDRVTVELVALLPDENAVVGFDDLAVTAAGEGESLSLQTRNGRSMLGAGGSLRIDALEEAVLLGVAPVVKEDAGLAALEAAGLLVLSDVGYRVGAAVLENGSGFSLSFVDGSGEVALEFPVEAAGVRAKSGGAGFEPVEADFEATDVAEVVLGTAGGRVALRFDPPAERAGGSLTDDSYRVLLGNERSVDLVVSFTAEREQGREMLRAAQEAASDGESGAALATVERLIATWPHDSETMRAGLELRNGLLDAQRARIDDLLREGAEASFFEARVGFRRVLRATDDLVAEYGEEHIARMEELEALRERLEAGRATLNAREGAQHGALLGNLADAFETTAPALAERIRGYVKTHYEGLQAPGEDGGQDAGDGGNDEEEGR